MAQVQTYECNIAKEKIFYLEMRLLSYIYVCPHNYLPFLKQRTRYCTRGAILKPVAGCHVSDIKCDAHYAMRIGYYVLYSLCSCRMKT